MRELERTSIVLALIGTVVVGCTGDPGSELSCEYRIENASDAMQTTLDAASRGCERDEDCSVFANRTRCYNLCDRVGVATASLDELTDELTAIDDAMCDSFASDGACYEERLGVTSTTCAAPWVAVCDRGTCRAKIQAL